MVIRKEDRVSTVLREDPALVDVFASLSPAFERLRKPGMRKVMSRLVTVEQAAAMAGLDADDLVERLNAGGDVNTDRPAEVDPRSVEDPADRAPGRPRALVSIPEEAVVELDVREDLRAGREPFSQIMAARREVPEGGALCVRAIFEPVPLYAVMQKQGLTHFTEQLGDEDWQVWFYPDGGITARPEESSDATDHPGASDGYLEAGGDITLLDVRGLEPPEPMVRTLAALEELSAGHTLVQINVRVPRFLLPQLRERGFTFEVREQEPGLVRVFIRHASPEHVDDNNPVNEEDDG